MHDPERESTEANQSEVSVEVAKCLCILFHFDMSKLYKYTPQRYHV
jgi:hypothetical protein